MTQKNIIFSESNHDVWIVDLAFLVDITGHLNIVHRGLQGKNKLSMKCMLVSKLSKLNYNCGIHN